MPTDISMAKIILMCSLTELANPQFAFSINWNLYHQIFNSKLPVFCHLKRLVEILGTTNFKSWQSFFFFLIKTTKISPPKISHQQTWLQSPMHWRSAALDRSCQDAHHRCSRSAPPPSSHCTPCRLRPAHLQNAHATLTLGCRCRPCKTLALGCCCRLYETLTLGRYYNPCETLVLGCYCSRNFHVLLINFCWSDL